MDQADFLVMRGIRRSFDGTQALKGVDFSARLGEVHAIVGENGAGKSTLMKILSGALQRDAGEILLGGVPAVIRSPLSAHRLGIRAVYQEFSLVRHLSITENILLGQMPTGKAKWLVDWKEAHRLAEAKLAEIGFTGLDVRTPVARLSVSHQQMVEIAKAAVTRPRIWILDEPSAVLSQEELKRLFEIIQKLKQESALILYISHRLDEVFEVADRITVLKDGELIGAARPEMLVGAGTVLSVAQARKAVDAGARFIVSPGFDPKVVDWCLKQEVAVIPGIATSTEALMALGKGLRVLKFFPAEELGGIPMLQAISAALIGVKFLPTGGITPANMPTYLRLPMVFAVAGSWLATAKMIAAGDFDKISHLAAEAVAVVQQERQTGEKG